MERPSAGDRVGLFADGLPNEPGAHEDPRKLRDIGCTRVLAGGVEPVGADEMRVGQPERRGLVVHQLREGRVVRCDRERERVGGVVRRLDQCTLDQVADGELLAGVELDRRLADCGGARIDGDDVGQLVVLERDAARSSAS